MPPQLSSSQKPKANAKQGTAPKKATTITTSMKKTTKNMKKMQSKKVIKSTQNASMKTRSKKMQSKNVSMKGGANAKTGRSNTTSSTKVNVKPMKTSRGPSANPGNKGNAKPTTAKETATGDGKGSGLLVADG